MPGDRRTWEPDPREMWVSTRRTSPGDGTGPPAAARTIDPLFNPPVAGEHAAYSLDEVWGLLDWPELVPPPAPGREYRLLYMPALAPGGLPDHPRLKLLGFDLSDSDHKGRSLLHDPCLWGGTLADIATRFGEYGLLGYEDAGRAVALFREAWPGVAGFTAWALYEILLDGAP